MENKVTNSVRWWHYLNSLTSRERYELALTGEPVIMRCVWCKRQNYKEHVNGDGYTILEKAAGHYLRMIYDIEDKDCICNECHDAIYKVTHYPELFKDMVMPKGDDWVEETEAFEKSLDTSWDIEDVIKEIDKEEKLAKSMSRDLFDESENISLDKVLHKEINVK